MTVTESRPAELVRIKLDFVKPMAGTSTTEFTFKPQGNQTTVTFAAAQGHLERNVFKPVIIQSVLESTTLLGDAAGMFALPPLEDLEQRVRLAFRSVDRVGEDLRVIARTVREG